MRGMMDDVDYGRSRVTGIFDRQIAFIGIDGATWERMEPLIAQGKLPNTATLMEQGAHGVLRSLPSLVSPRIWTSIATGKVPEKHGVTGFFATAHDVKAARIWDIVERYGGSIGLLGMIPTWPPRPVKGFMIPGWMARDSETYPADLRFIKELEIGEKNERRRRFAEYFKLSLSALQHGIRVPTLAYALCLILYDKLFAPPHLELIYRKRLIKFWLQADLLCWLLERNNLVFAGVRFDLIDSISHRYWKYMEPQGFASVSRENVHRYGNVIPRGYMEVDKAIGRILERLDKDTTVIVVSDHGFQANLSKGSGATAAVKIEPLIQRLSLPTNIDGFSVGRSFTVNTRRTTREAERTMDEAFEKLKTVSILGTQEPIFRVSRIDPYTLHLKLKRIPGKDDQLMIAGTAYKAHEILQLRDSSVISGTHQEEGIIIIRGNGVKPSYRLRKASVLDVTPTLLYLLGLPVAEDMDGEVLTEAFESEYLACHPVQSVSAYDADQSHDVSEPVTDEKVLRERLRDLGYID